MASYLWPMCMASNLPKATLTFPVPSEDVKGLFQSSVLRYSINAFCRPTTELAEMARHRA